jgi:UDP-N-acetylglucosamine transferase subunit ALG13
MIFVTVGTERYPFDRLLQFVDFAVQKNNVMDEIIFQLGPSFYQPKRGQVKKFLPFTTMREHLKNASLVITHGGVGTVNLCLSLGKKPLVCPRRKSLREAIDDHQLYYSRFMEEKGYLLVAESQQELEDKMMRLIQEGPATNFSQPSKEKGRLISFLNSLL